MEKPKYRSALIVGTGPGLSASLARLFAKRAGRFAGRPPDRQARRARQGNRRRGPCLQRRRSDGSCRPVRGPRRQGPHARRRGLQREQPRAWPAGRPGAGRCQTGHRDQRLRRLFGLAAGGQTDAAQVARRHLPDRRHGRREGLRALGHLRHGQVRAAWPRAIDGPRAVAQGHPCRPFRDRRRHPGCGRGRCRTTRPTACSIPTPSPRPTGRRCSSTAAPGAGRSRSGRGSRSSEN